LEALPIDRAAVSIAVDRRPRACRRARWLALPWRSRHICLAGTFCSPLHGVALPLPGNVEANIMFKLLGIMLAIYTMLSAVRGEVYAKHRAWGRSIRRDEEAGYFWVVIGIYSGLSLALLLVF
jgi:hypothetical protein